VLFFFRSLFPIVDYLSPFFSCYGFFFFEISRPAAFHYFCRPIFEVERFPRQFCFFFNFSLPPSGYRITQLFSFYDLPCDAHCPLSQSYLSVVARLSLLPLMTHLPRGAHAPLGGDAFSDLLPQLPPHR